MTSEEPPNTPLTDEEKQQMIDHGNERIARLRMVDSAPRVFIVSGPSGVGKDAVLESLQEAYPAARYVVTSTSRPIREGEKQGVHYNFLDRDDLKRQIEAGEYLESDNVYGNLYGVPRRPILEGLANGQHVIIKVDVKGAATLRSKIDPVTSMFLTAESMEELYRRLSDRKTDKQEAIARRFRTACEELDRADEFDYVVFNEACKLDRTVADIRRIIDAELRRINQPEVRITSA